MTGAGSDAFVRDISDTARWAAGFRAIESESASAVFHDPYARRLAGERGMQAVEAMPSGREHLWAWTTRTWLFDQFISECVRRGTDAVINLAAGLDARPYRMHDLPPTLQWIEVDLPPLIAYKEELLRDEQPHCALRRFGLDLSDVDARRQLFDRIGNEFRNGLVITEGLLIYLAPAEVGELARDLATRPGFTRWVLELTSPGLLRILQKNIGGPLEQARAPLRFGPPEGPEFLLQFGWRPVDVRSMIKTAARLRKSPLFLRLLAMLPESKGQQGNRPWSAVCLYDRRPSSGP